MIETLDAALDSAAAAFGSNLDVDGYEYHLTGEVLEGIPEDQRAEALAWLVHEAIAELTYGGRGLLNECAPETYEVTDRLAGILLEAIKSEGEDELHLAQLITREICDREQIARILRQSAPKQTA